jgi:hypothetical protein
MPRTARREGTSLVATLTNSHAKLIAGENQSDPLVLPRFLRYLRIAFSATCLIACVLLIALWVRSYWCDANSQDIVDRVFYCDSANRVSSAMSTYGAFHLNIARPRESRESSYEERYGDSVPPNVISWTVHFAEGRILGFGASTKDLASDIRVPCWFSVLLTGMLAAVVWLPWRFRLRTLLMATTLVAVVLGLVVWMSRAG